MVVSSNHPYSTCGRKLDHHVVSGGDGLYGIERGFAQQHVISRHGIYYEKLYYRCCLARGSPRVSINCIDPKGSTFSPKNPRRWVLTGSSFSLSMPILSKADAKMMSAELPLSTRTRWIVLLATTALITRGSSWGCWHPSRSEYENVMVVSSQGSLDTACTSITSPDLMLCK